MDISLGGQKKAHMNAGSVALRMDGLSIFGATLWRGCVVENVNKITLLAGHIGNKKTISIDKDWLIKEYVTNEIPISHIVKKTGYSTYHIRKLLVKAGVKIRLSSDPVHHKCPVCGRSFIGITNQKYCSATCRQASKDEWSFSSFHIFIRDGFRCRYCGRGPADGVSLTIDHVWPRSKNQGDESQELILNNPINLVTACNECNGHKSAILLDTKTMLSIWNKNVDMGIHNPLISTLDDIAILLKEQMKLNDYEWNILLNSLTQPAKDIMARLRETK